MQPSWFVNTVSVQFWELSYLPYHLSSSIVPINMCINFLFKKLRVCNGAIMKHFIEGLLAKKKKNVISWLKQDTLCSKQ